MKIIKYKVFNSSEEFEKWQEGCYDKIEIYQVQPMIFNMDTNNISQTDELHFKTNIGLFITYSEY